MTDATLARRIFLVGLVLIVLYVSGCAVIWPDEVGPSEQILASRYVTDEMRAQFKDLEKMEMPK